MGIGTGARSPRWACYTGYSIVLFSFVCSLAVEMLVKYTTTYAVPTAVYAVQITKNGNLIPPLFNRSYWQENLQVETEFNLPSILLSMVLITANIARDNAISIPISGLATLVYFPIARLVLCEDGDPRGYGVLFAAVSYSYMAWTRIGAIYTGRATLGVALLMQFVFLYLLLLRACTKARRSVNLILIPLVILTVAIAYTYYFSTLAIFLCTMLTTMAIWVLTTTKRIRFPSMPTLFLIFLSLVFMVYGPLMSLATSLRGVLDPTYIIRNFVLYLRNLARLEGQSEQYLTQAGIVEKDLLTRVTGSWFFNAIKLASAIALVCALVAYWPRKSSAPRLIWLYAVSAIFVSLSEVAYLFVTPTAPIRFLSIFGLIAMIFVVKDFAEKGNNLPPVPRPPRLHRRQILAGCVLIVLALGCIGSLSNDWNYEVGKPFAYDQSKPLSTFLLSSASNDTPMNLTGDAIHMVDLFYITYVHEASSRIQPEPLGLDSLTLYEASISGNKEQFVENMKTRNIQLLVMFQDGRPVWGDEWGYGFTVRTVNSLDLPMVYNDGYSQLYLIY